MSTTKVSRRTRVRMAMTGESWTQARCGLLQDGEKSSSPLPRASFAQQQFEGLVLREMRYFRDRDEIRGRGHDAQFPIRTVSPSRDCLEIYFEVEIDMLALAECILPRHEQSGGAPYAEVYGVPGLRFRSGRHGVELFRPNTGGMIVLRGLNWDQWCEATAEVFSDTHVSADSCSAPWRVAPDFWCPHEQYFASSRPERGLAMHSAVLRRFHAFSQLPHVTLDCYDKSRRLVFEVVQETYSHADHARFVSAMTADGTLRYEPKAWPPNEQQECDRYLEFTMPQTRTRLLVHLVNDRRRSDGTKGEALCRATGTGS